MKAIIFGISGQDGHYLTDLLEKEGVEVVGVSRSEGVWKKGSVSDYNFVSSLIQQSKPEYVFHLAADSTTKHDALFENHKTISTGTINILESVRLYSPKTRVFISGSAMQFKNIGKPISESSFFDASSPYSVSRIHSVFAARYFRKKFGIKAFVGYFFNHDSPLRTERHINKKIAEAVKRISEGSSEKIEIGDIKVKKEFNFAGDVVEAIWLLVNQEKYFEAVIGSGKAYSIKQYLEECFKFINKDWKDHVAIKKNYVSEYKILVSKPKIIKSIGWRPKVGFKQIVELMMK